MKFTFEQYLNGRIEECGDCPFPIRDRCDRNNCKMYETLCIIEELQPYYDEAYNRLKQQELNRQRDEIFFKELHDSRKDNNG